VGRRGGGGKSAGSTERGVRTGRRRWVRRGGGGGKSLSALIAVIKFENLPDPPPTKILRLRISNRPRLTPDIAARAQADYFQPLSGEPFRAIVFSRKIARPNRAISSPSISRCRIPRLAHRTRALIARTLAFVTFPHFRAVYESFDSSIAISKYCLVGISLTANSRVETRLLLAKMNARG